MRRILLACSLMLVCAASASAQQFLARMQVAADPDFQKRIEFALLKTAIAVTNEDPTLCCYPEGVTHATATDEQKAAARALNAARVRFAGNAMRNSQGTSVQVAKAVVTNLALTTQSTDADIEFTVISMWNAFVNAGGNLP